MSRKTDLNLSLGIDISAFEKGLADALKISRGEGKKLEQQAQMQAEAIQQQMLKIGDAQNLSQVNAEMNTLVEMMVTFGLQGSKAFQEVVTQAGELKKKQQDIKNLINANMATPWKAMGTAVRGAAQALSLFQSGMALFGDQSEDTQKTLLKVHAAMSFAQGLEGLAALKDGFKALGIVIRANPIFFAATAIAAIAVAAYKLTQTLDETNKTLEETAKYQKTLNDAFKDSGLKTVTADVNNFKIQLELARDKVISKELALQTYNETIGKATGVVKTLDEAEQWIVKNGNSYIQMTLLKAAANLALEEAATASLNAEKARRKSLDEFKRTPFLAPGVSTGVGGMGGGSFNPQLAEEDKKRAEDAAKNRRNDMFLAAKKAEKDQSDIAKSFMAQSQKIAAEMGITGLNVEKTPKQKKPAAAAKSTPFDVDLKALVDNYTQAKNIVKAALFNNQITEANAKKQLEDLDILHANKKFAIHKKHGKNVKEAEGDLLDDRLAYMKNHNLLVMEENKKLMSFEIKPIDFKIITDPARKAAGKALEEMAKVSEAFNQLLTDSAQGLIETMASNMGQSLIMGEDISKTFGESILNALGSFMKQFGKMMIVVGIAKMKFDTAIAGFGSGGLAIVAGAALVAAGSAMNAIVQKGIKPTALAEGGVLRGTTFGMLAEYPTANNDPEVAIRSSYLRNMIGDAVGGGGMGGAVEFKIVGRDLVGVLNRGNKDIKRA
jgi:hypothetical protein